MALSNRYLPGLCGVLCLALAVWLYSPGISGPAMLDDRSSLAALERSVVDLSTALDYTFADRSGLLGRPLSIASFALEKLVLDWGTRGHKAINIAIHLINGVLVAWLFALLLGRAGFGGYRWTATLCAAAWLLSPLYVSTVLYSVQRMTLLACLFMCLTLIQYLYLRRAWPGVAGWREGLLATGILLAFAAGLACKENAIVVAPILVLLELLWLDGRDAAGSRSPWLIGACRLGVAVLVLGFLLVAALLVFSPGLLPAPVDRTFTTPERVLTEARILWDYLAQLLRPEVARMGLYHDDWPVSRSLLQPLSTLWSLLAWVLVGLGSVLLLRAQQGRYLVFAVVFYLLGHSVESTILPLELYFEHRNYFPGIGLFLGIAVSLSLAASRWPASRPPLQAWLGVWVFLLSLQTSSQVQIWSNLHLLRLNHLAGHPHSARANLDMATEMASLGELDAALRYSQKAHQLNPLEHPGDRDLRSMALACTAGGGLPNPEQMFREHPRGLLFRSVGTAELLVARLIRGGCESIPARQVSDLFRQRLFPPERAPAVPAEGYAALAILENHLEDYQPALSYTRRYLEQSPASAKGWLMRLQFTSLLQLSDERQLALRTLRDMQAQGLLSYTEQETLALYGD